MTRYLSILALVGAVACGGDEDGPVGTDTDVSGDDDTSACTNAILGQTPENGDLDVYYRTDVRFTLTVEDPAASITLMEVGGGEVSGTTSVAGSIVSWTPGAPLTPETAYEATLTYECGAATVGWTTSDVGTPTDVDLTGRTYSLGLTDGEFIEPPGVGVLLAQQLGDVEILIGVESVAGPEIDMDGALGLGDGTQDLCSETLTFPPATYDDPYFSLTSPVLPLDVTGIQIDVENLELSGAFSKDGSRIQGAVLKGLIDTRPLVDLVSPGGTEGSACSLVNAFGVDCIPCSDGTGDFCLSLWIDSIEATEVGGTLVPRDAQTIADDAACD